MIEAASQVVLSAHARTLPPRVPTAGIGAYAYTLAAGDFERATKGLRDERGARP